MVLLGIMILFVESYFGIKDCLKRYVILLFANDFRKYIYVYLEGLGLLEIDVVWKKL